MARFAIGVAIVASLAACSAILGLTDPTTDNSIGAGGDGGASDGGSSDSPFEATTCPGGGNTANDPKNCGTCGHDCLGGGCNAGACQPVLVVDDEAHLAPRFMVEDDTTLYFTNARSDEPINSVSKVSKTGVDGSSPAELIARFDQDDGGNVPVIFPYQLALSGSDIYVALTAEEYTDNTYLGGIAKCPGVNCDTNNLFIPLLDSAAIAANSQQVIYGYEDLLDGGLGSEQYEVHSYVIPGNTYSTITSIGARVNFIALGNSSDVYVAADTGIFKTDTTGPAATQLTTFEADQLALFNNIVYVTSAPTGLPATVQSVPIAGGTTPTVLAQGAFLHVPAGIAVDTNFIYVADSGDISQRGDGQVFRCPLSGCGNNGSLATVLSTGPSAAQNPRTIVTDTTAIYWGNRYGQIWKLAK